VGSEYLFGDALASPTLLSRQRGELGNRMDAARDQPEQTNLVVTASRQAGIRLQLSDCLASPAQRVFLLK
jgi:hypothetical protein